MIAQRQLHEYTVHAFVVVELIDLCNDLIGADIGIELNVVEFNASLHGCLPLHAYIRDRVRPCTYLQDNEMGLKPRVPGALSANAFGDLIANIPYSRLFRTTSDDISEPAHFAIVVPSMTFPDTDSVVAMIARGRTNDDSKDFTFKAARWKTLIFPHALVATGRNKDIVASSSPALCCVNE